MISFFVYRPNGEIVSTGYCPEDQLENQRFSGANVSKGKAVIGCQYFDNGTLVNIPTKPMDYCIFDYNLKHWVQDIQIAKKQIGLIRNKLLFVSDWTQLPDVPLETKQAWATYRQALRDITNQEGYPFNVIWPKKPE